MRKDQKEGFVMKKVFFALLPLIFWAGFVFPVSPLWAQKDNSKDQARKEIRKMAKDTLDSLYKAQPSSKKAIQSAAGYAVFRNFGTKIFFAGGGTGKGLAVNNKTKKETFMKMIEIQAGLGLGIKRFRLIWVFQTQKALENFINSWWELGSQATASAQLDDKGGGLAGAIAISQDVWMYQLTDDGLALELTAKESKYYKNDDLN
jgi:lipid-binding SYLF domain-containing protein